MRALELVLVFFSLVTTAFADVEIVKGSQQTHTVCRNVTINKLTGQKLEQKIKEIQQCQVIEGHLEIREVTLSETTSFPNLIQVTDYVVLYFVQGVNSVAKLFPRLSVIRGGTLFYDYALVLIDNHDLREIGPWSLRSVNRGAIRLESNIVMCLDNTTQFDKLTQHEYYRNLNFIHKNFNYCPFDDCEEEGWCAAREKTCQDNGGCFGEKGCHKECLGGCNCSNDATCCAACKLFLLKEECVTECPKNTREPYLKYLDYRCITEAQCLSYNWVIYDDKDADEDPTCIPTCPEGFVYRNFSGKCEKRQRSDWCEGTTITSTDLGSSLKDCSSIRGNLFIMVTGGKNVTRTLKRNLGKLEVISGYLRVVGADALRSLNFLPKLRLIKGEQVSQDGCTICIFENANLEQLWDWTAKNRSKLVVTGHINVAFNERLCNGEVINFFNQSGINSSNIKLQSNGKSASCVIFHSPMVAVPGKEPGTVKLSFYHNWCGKDYQTITDYSIYYQQTDQNVTIYEDRDVCNEHTLWTRVTKVEKLFYESHCLDFELDGLEPNKRYAIYAKSHSIDNYSVQTDIVYVTTYPREPDVPDLGNGTISGNDLKISWVGPLSSFPDGGFYEVGIQLEAEKLTRGFQFNEDCKKFGETLSNKLGHYKNAVESVSVKKNSSYSEQSCSCPSMDYDDILTFQKEKIAIKKDIDRLYYKVEIESKPGPPQSNNENGTVLEEDDELTLLCDAGHVLPGKCPDPASLWDTEYPEFAVLDKPFNWTNMELAAASKMQYLGLTEKNDIRIPLPININMPTKITIQVRACGKKISPCRFSDSHSCVLCSKYLSWTIYKEEKIPPLHLKVVPAPADEKRNGILSYTEFPCDKNEFYPLRNTSAEFSKNRMNLRISWDSSYDHENTVLGYRIQYVPMDTSMMNTNAICWSKLSADENKSTFHVEVPFSNVYMVGIQTRTVAGYGQPEKKCFQIHDNNTYLYWIIIAVLSIVVLIVMVANVVVYRRKSQEIQAEIVYNDFYDLFLIKLNRELRLKKEMLGMMDPNSNILGRGQFGQVHKDVFTDRNKKKRDVAVKTIRERDFKNDQEREGALDDLLQEALKYPEFDSPFVLELLGVYHQDEPPRNLYLVFEYMDMMDLKNILKKRRDRLPQYLMEEVLIQDAAGMAHIHDRNFVHGDLAARNIMVSYQGSYLYKNETRERWIVKVSDFGLTICVGNHYYYIDDPKKNVPDERFRPARWMAPESFKKGEIYKESDAWSFGVLIWEILNQGRLPYENDSTWTQIEDSIHHDYLIKNCCTTVKETEFLKKLMKKCLQITPNLRPKFHEIVDEILPQLSEPFQKEFIHLSNWKMKKSNDNGSTDDGYGESCTGNSMNVSHDNEEDQATSSFSTSLGPCFDGTSSTSLTEDEYMTKRSSFLSLA